MGALETENNISDHLRCAKKGSSAVAGSRVEKRKTTQGGKRTLGGVEDQENCPAGFRKRQGHNENENVLGSPSKSGKKKQCLGALARSPFQDASLNRQPEAADYPASLHTTQSLGPLLGNVIKAKLSQQVPHAQQQLPNAAPGQLPQQPAFLHNQTSQPIDWSLKSSVRFCSEQPLKCCKEGLTASSLTVTSARNCFVREEAEFADCQEEWQAALLSWQHPEVCLEPSTVALLSSKQSDFMARRKLLWQRSFRSLYSALRSGSCKAFYVVLPKAAKTSFTAFFGAAGIGGRAGIHAFISRSTRGLRKMLKEAGGGLEFTMPLAPMPTGSSDAATRAGSGQGPSQARLSEGMDNKAASLLAFEGPVQVHGIYNWLLDSVMLPAAQDHDVPLLLAPGHFHGATLHCFEPQVQAPVVMPQSGRRSHWVAIKGPIPPWTFQRLCRVLQTSHDGSIQVYTETEKSSSNLNVTCVPAVTYPRPEPVDERVGAWYKPVLEMAGYCLKAISHSIGHFDLALNPAV